MYDKREDYFLSVPSYLGCSSFLGGSASTFGGSVLTSIGSASTFDGAER